MTFIQTFVVEKNDLMREGLKAFISGKSYKVSAEFKGIEKILSVARVKPPQLVIIGINIQILSAYNAQEEISKFKMEICQARKEFPDTRFILLISQEAVYHIPDLYSWDIDGYICKDVTKDGFMNYLNLVMIGERVVPAQSNYFNGHAVPGTHKTTEQNLTHNYKDPDFSTRENDILRYLSRGNSNKKIAGELQISESTVKVHTKTILRKLGVSNRTQAALWAIKHGFSGAAESLIVLNLTTSSEIIPIGFFF